MKGILVGLNLLAVLFVLAWGAEYFVAPRVAVVANKGDYKRLMFQCDQVMREHFIAKQLVLARPNDESIRNLEAAEIGLTNCHDYDKLRKHMLNLGVSENELAAIGLEAIEERGRDVRHFVETHEIRY